jgi:hypothetical protein
MLVRMHLVNSATMPSLRQASGRQLQGVRGELLHRETKPHASEATLPLPSICLTALQQRQTAQNRARSAAGAAWNHSDPGETDQNRGRSTFWAPSDLSASPGADLRVGGGVVLGP